VCASKVLWHDVRRDSDLRLPQETEEKRLELREVEPDDVDHVLRYIYGDVEGEYRLAQFSGSLDALLRYVLS
jgi:hypothetical protein